MSAGPDLLTQAIDSLASGHDLGLEEAAAVLHEIMAGNASETPISCRVAPAGLVSGPRKLKIVRTASCRRTGMTKRVAWWWAGANMKPNPTSSMQRAT